MAVVDNAIYVEGRRAALAAAFTAQRAALTAS